MYDSTLGTSHTEKNIYTSTLLLCGIQANISGHTVSLTKSILTYPNLTYPNLT